MTRHDTTDALDRRPTRFSTAAVVGVTVLTTVLLVTAVGLTTRVLYGAAGAALLAVVLWLLSTDRLEALGAAVGAATFPVIGLSLLAGTGYTIAAQLRDVLPIGSVFLVIGATVAVFGATVAIRDVLDEETLVRCLGTMLRTTIVVTAAMTLAALLRFAPLGRQVGAGIGVTLAAVFAPSATVPLASFLCLVLAGVYGTRAAILASPADAVFGASIDDRTRARLRALDHWLVVAAVPLVGLTLAAVLLEVALPTPYAWLPGGVTALLGALVSPESPRVVLGVAAVVSAIALVTIRVVQSTYRTSNRDALAAIVPFLSGLALAVVAVWAHGPFLSALTGRIEQRLPEPLTDPFRSLVADVLAVYGGQLLALVVLTGLLLLTLLLVFGLLVTVLLGLVPERASGASIAAAGLFTAAAFAAALDAPLSLALAGVVASLFVWDAGAFGVTLGTELGRQATTIRTELAHSGGTLLVGAGTVVAALGIDAAVGSVSIGTTAGLAALVGAIAAVLLLVIASR